ncbi:hypothetical protein M2281_002393 [Mesorhizobium soli]|nr:hypothetical protein [Mesorhizobium soli]
MSPNLQSQLRSSSSAFAAAGFALCAAASAYVLPAWDEVLPGGAIIWQAVALVTACLGAVRAWRRLPIETSWSPAMVVRFIAAAALLMALLWLIGVGILWLVWPR